MLFSTQTDVSVSTYGLFEGGGKIADAGFPAIDLTMFNSNDYLFKSDWRETADRLSALAKEKGFVFNQAHAPFGGGYDHYTKVLVPQMPRVFEFAGRLGIRNIVVHPLQRGRYYGHEKELFDMNMGFYRSLAPYAKNSGIKIAIENMFQGHPVTHRIVDDVCADPHELADYYDALDDSEAFTVCLDLGHVALCGREPQDAIRIIGHDRLGALHVQDVDYASDLHTLPGMGNICWDEVCRALADIDYIGDLTLEADNFLVKYDNNFKPTVLKFMAKCASHLASKTDSYRNK